KSFLKESCIVSIRFAFIPGVYPLKKGNPKNLGITAIRRLFCHWSGKCTYSLVQFLYDFEPLILLLSRQLRA
ncbi:hypothetical protein CA599_06905, partial [Paenibacillus taichungensis]